MAVLIGDTNENDILDFTTVGHTAAWPFVAQITGDVWVIYSQAAAINTCTNVRFGIYADNGSGTDPGSLLRVADVADVALANTYDGVASATFGAPVGVVVGTIYWLAWVGLGANRDFRGIEGGDYAETLAVANFPEPFGTTNHSTVIARIWGEGDIIDPDQHVVPDRHIPRGRTR